MSHAALDTLLSDINARLAPASGDVAERARILRALDAADEALQREYEKYALGDAPGPGADPRVAAYHDVLEHLRCAREPSQRPRSLSPHVAAAERAGYEAELERLIAIADRSIRR